MKNDMVKCLEEQTEKIKITVNEICNKRIGQLEEIVKQQRIKIAELERDTRNKNLIFHGVEEVDDNNTEETVLNIIENELKITCNEDNLDFVKRLGRKDNNKIRPILIKFATGKMRRNILENSRKLKDTNIFITEDFPKEVLEKRKILVSEMKKCREEGKYAIIKYDKLVVKDKFNQQWKKDETKSTQVKHTNLKNNKEKDVINPKKDNNKERRIITRNNKIGANNNSQ